MEERGIHHLVVETGGRVEGMLSDRDILLSTGWMLATERRIDTGQGSQVIGPTRIEQIMSRPAQTLSNNDSTRHAARAFMTGKISAAAVVEADRLVGIVADADLVRWLITLAADGNTADRLLSSPVQALMRANVLTLSPEASIGDIVDLFRRYRIRHVPVTTGGVLTGIISDRDVRRALGWCCMRDMEADEEARLFDGPRKSVDIMQSDVQTIGRLAPLSAALLRMLEERIHSLVVVDADGLIGIITQTDFVKFIAREELL